MATKTTKKQTKDLSVSPVKYTSVSEKEEEKSIEDILNASLKVGDYLSDASVQTVVEEPVKKEEKTKPSTIEELVVAIDEVNKKFEGVTDKDYYPEEEMVKIPASLDLEKMDVPTIDEDKLREEISEEETKKIDAEKKKLEDNSLKEQENKRAEIENEQLKSEIKKQEIQDIYDDYKVSVESDALKRGLARSSVALLSIEGVESKRANELVKVAENLTSVINGLEQDIVKLQQGLNASLEQLDLELAENINKEIKTKIESLEKKRQEAIEFNNKVSEMEAEYQMKRLDNMDEAAKLEETLAKKYYGYAESDKREQKVQLALDYFSSMDKTTALNAIISSPELASVLGDAYYDLYYYTMRR